MIDNTVRFAMSVLRRATDWQEAQHAIADHPHYGRMFTGADDPALSAVISEAEVLLGDDLPY
jgi:hypothetical protein